jgi:heptosyltransferase-1
MEIILSNLYLEFEIVQEIHHPRLKLLFPVSLVEYAYIIYKAKWFVGADSLPLHLAGWFSTPSFSLFGPSSDFYYAPKGDCHASWQGSCPYNITFVKRCPRLRSCETGACLRQAPDKSIKESLETWLNKMG